MSKVFLSHSSRDNRFAGKLSQRLDAEGIRSWVAEAEIKVGDSLIQKIEAAIREVDYVAVILSPNSVSSEWVRREVNIAITDEIRGRRVKVLPVLFKKCEVPSFLADKLYADFTRDFEEGLGQLMSRLRADQHGEISKEKGILEFIESSFHGWDSLGRQDSFLLNADGLRLILKPGALRYLSLDIAQYVVFSILRYPESEWGALTELGRLLEELGTRGRTLLFERVRMHGKSEIRSRVATLIRHVGEKRDLEAMLREILGEQDVGVIRETLLTSSRLGLSIPKGLARVLYERETDWLVRSRVIMELEGRRSCAIVTDRSAFATQLGRSAKDAGFELTVLPGSACFEDLEAVREDVLRAHELIVVVRGEDFGLSGNDNFYSKLQAYVSDGGSLFATPWVSWETRYHHSFDAVLPFHHDGNLFFENVRLRCGPAHDTDGQQLFAENLSYVASVEVLRPRQDSTVLLETPEHRPIFGYRHFGAGTCYYFNTCQHNCTGKMASPLESSIELRSSIERVFKWIYARNSRH